MWSGPKSWWNALYSRASSTVKYTGFRPDELTTVLLFRLWGDLETCGGTCCEVVLWGSGIADGGKGVLEVGGEVYDAR